MKKIFKSLASLILAGLLLLGLASWPDRSVRAAAVWFVVPGGNDSNDCASPSTPCGSIYSAVQQADPGDTVQVAQGTFTNPQGAEYMLLLMKNITLSGGWDEAFTMQSGLTTVDGQGDVQGLYVDNSVTASVSGFMFERGGILNRGTLTLTTSFVMDNQAAGIVNAGIMHMDQDVVSYNTAVSAAAGGINNSGVLTITASTIANNASYYGYSSSAGAIWNSGTLLIDTTSIFNNFSDNNAGAIYATSGGIVIRNSVIRNNTSVNFGGGMDVYLVQDPVYISNTTFSNNSSGEGGAIYFGAQYGSEPLYLNNVTLAENTASTSTGGVYSGGLVHLQNTILAGNTGPTDASDCSGTFQSEGYNLIQNTSGCTLSGIATGNQLDLNAGVLPFVQVWGFYPLASYSPAVNAGDPAGCKDGQGNSLLSDQRGVPRTGRCDVGAYEYKLPGPVASLFVESGGFQSIGVSKPFPEPLQARALDEYGTPVGSVSISFTSPSSGPGGTFADNGLSAITVTTNEAGFTPELAFTANALPGDYSVTAVDPLSAMSVDFYLSNMALLHYYLPLVFR